MSEYSLLKFLRLIVDGLDISGTKSPSSHFNNTLSVVRWRRKGNIKIYGSYICIEVKFTMFGKKGYFSHKSL